MNFIDDVHRELELQRAASSRDNLLADLTALVERYTRVVGDPSDAGRSVKLEERPIPVHLIRELLEKNRT